MGKKNNSIKWEERINDSWNKCRDWIAEKDGSANEFVITNIFPDNLITTLKNISHFTQNSGFGSINIEKDNSQESFGNNVDDIIRALQEETLSYITGEFLAVIEDFEFKGTLTTDTDEFPINISIIWWPEDVFTINSDGRSRYYSLVKFILSLLELSDKSKIHIGPDGFFDTKSYIDEFIEI